MLVWTHTHPFLDLRIVATNRLGAPVAVHEPSLDLGVHAVQARVAPGASARWRTPVALAFAGSAAAADRFTWRVDAPRDAVDLVAEVEVAGAWHRCPIGPGESGAPLLDVRDAPSPRPGPAPEVIGAQLAALLAGPPSSEAWSALRHLMVAWPADTAGPPPTADVDARLAHWPDALRVVSGAIVHAEDELLPRFGPLARVVTVSTRSEAGNGWLRDVAVAPELSGVVALDVTRSELTWSTLAALLRGPGLPRLASLDLTLQHWTPELLAALAAAPRLAQLRRLGLRSGRLTDAMVIPLFDGRALPALRELDLRYNRLSDAGKAWLRAWWSGPPGGLQLDDGPR